ncbi:uncharacterized protein METZ01_LOCUS286737, partial [marine metagenome]
TSYINMTIYGDDSTTPDADEGMNAGEDFVLRLWDSSEDIIYEYPESFDCWYNNYGAPMDGCGDVNTIYDFHDEGVVSYTVYYNPDENYNGSDEFTYEVNDEELVDTAIVTISVSSVNDTPVLSVIADTSTAEDEDLTISLSASDIDIETNGQGLTFNAFSSDTTLVLVSVTSKGDVIPTSSGGVFQGQAVIDGMSASAGDMIAAFDEDGNVAGASEVVMYDSTAYINLTIYGDDAYTEGVDEGMNEGEAFVLRLWDSSEDITYVYPDSFDCWYNTFGAPMDGCGDVGTVFNFSTESPPVVSPWAGDSTSTMALDVQPEQNGEADITVTVTDSEGAGDTRVFVFTVNAVNDTPVLTEVGNQVTDEDEDLTISLSASDVDIDENAQSLTFSAVSSDTTLVLVSTT